MWLLGLLLVSMSAFLFANTQWIANKIQMNASDWLFAKLPALAALLIGGHINNLVWAVESGISLTIGTFGFGMVMAVYFKLEKPKASKKQLERETN